MVREPEGEARGEGEVRGEEGDADPPRKGDQEGQEVKEVKQVCLVVPCKCDSIVAINSYC